MSGDVETPPALDTPGEYGIAYSQERRPVSKEERKRLRREYGWIRTFFKTRPDRHYKMQRWLNQARIAATFDEYLATTFKYSLLVGLLGALLGLLAAYQLLEMGVIAGLESPFDFRGSLVTYISENRAVVAGAAIVLVVGGLFGTITWAARYYYPRTIVSTRRQSIDMTLPHAIVFMYALSHGGMGLLQVMKTIAQAEETYGEVANEFEMIVNDIELFGSDVYTALQNARNLTPSENFEQFLDDMIGVLDAGGDVTLFFEEESETFLREAKDAQESFLETLALLAEVFVVGFVAAPLFLIVTLVVISLIGGSTVGAITLLVYVVMPVSVVAFLFLIDLLSKPFAQIRSIATPEDLAVEVDPAELKGDKRFGAYRRTKRKVGLFRFLRDPLRGLKLEPKYTLVLSVPVSAVAVGLLITSGAITPTLTALLEAPITVTTGLVVLPLLVITVPLSLFHETKRRRENEIARRFPDTLNILSSANKMGIPLTEAIDLVSRWSAGIVAEELRTVRNDITWNHDTTAALLAFGYRLRVPQLARTMKLLAEGIRSSGDLSRVLAIAAEDTRNRERLDRARRRELSTYIAVVVMGFLVYLLVVVMLDASFLQPIAALSEDAGSTATEAPISFVTVPVNTYRAVFFHSALIMAVGSGLLAGKLSDNDAVSGLKYGIGMVVLTLAVFLFI